MKDLVNEIYGRANSDWDGDFLALDDETKDFAVREYLNTDGEGAELLDEIFPECCFGAEKLLLNLLYDKPNTFSVVVSALLKGEMVKLEDCLISEAILPHDQAQLIADLWSDRFHMFAKTFADLVYRYVEDALRDGCAAWFNEIHSEYCQDLYSYTED